MKVCELIDELSELPDDMELVITDLKMQYVCGIKAVYYVDTRDEADRMPCSKVEATGIAILCDSNFSGLHE